MDDTALVGVVVGHSVKLVCDFLLRLVSGGGNSGFALAAGYDFDTEMISSSLHSLESVIFFPGYGLAGNRLFLFGSNSSQKSPHPLCSQ